MKQLKLSADDAQKIRDVIMEAALRVPESMKIIEGKLTFALDCSADKAVTGVNALLDAGFQFNANDSLPEFRVESADGSNFSHVIVDIPRPLEPLFNG